MRKGNEKEIAAKKHERFVRIATARVNNLVDAFEKLGNCSSKVSYEYTDVEVEQILAEVCLLSFPSNKLWDYAGWLSPTVILYSLFKRDTSVSIALLNRCRSPSPMLSSILAKWSLLEAM